MIRWIAMWIIRFADKLRKEYEPNMGPMVVYKEPRVIIIRVKKMISFEERQQPWMKDYLAEEVVHKARPYVKIKTELNPFGHFDIEGELHIYDHAND